MFKLFYRKGGFIVIVTYGEPTSITQKSNANEDRIHSWCITRLMIMKLPLFTPGMSLAQTQESSFLLLKKHTLQFHKHMSPMWEKYQNPLRSPFQILHKNFRSLVEESNHIKGHASHVNILYRSCMSPFIKY